MTDLRGTRTEANLRAAFAADAQADRRFTYFARRADIEGRPEAARLFRDLAAGETGHALGHLELLEEAGDPVTGMPVGDTETNLRSALAGETHEHGELYPALARTAREEGFEEIAEWFESLAGAHGIRARRLAATLRSVTGDGEDG
ncbi:MAG TPA: rubrerythrin family protein [Candidatus Dormibacteraeota bacterium]|jgi:rubrerythrin|nr:rubrerythrin family protein [Candidatus Dormibacteraeota bacterium]